MRLGMIGLGRMGANMARRLVDKGHECVGYDLTPTSVAALATDGVAGASSLADLAQRLAAPRVVWLMLPAAHVDSTIVELSSVLSAGDVIVDGGNSHYHDDIRRAQQLAPLGIHYVDVGTSGGVWGRERGYCLMIGGEPAVVSLLEPIFAALAPAFDSAPRTPGREKVSPDTAEHGYLHCGPAGAGHFVKMIHNGIEYGMMGAFAEGLNVLKNANCGSAKPGKDAEHAPLRHPEHYRYDFDLAAITELWRRGSVVTSWLLDLIAQALLQSPNLEEFTGRVADSGEGRWTVQAAVDEGVPVHVLSAALFDRFTSRGNAEFQNQVLSAMRFGFGGHVETRGEKS